MAYIKREFIYGPRGESGWAQHTALTPTPVVISTDGRHSFIRTSETPVMDRSDEGLSIRALHSIIHENGRWTFGTTDGAYLTGYAQSPDGNKWLRMDERVGIQLSSDGWDSKTICYPSLLKWRDRTYLFYNGNDMGKLGFGYAELQLR